MSEAWAQRQAAGQEGQGPQYPEDGGAPRKRKRRGRVVAILLAVIVLPAALVGVQLVRPVPEAAIKLNVAATQSFPGTAPTLPWPTKGQAVVDVEGLGTMGSYGSETPTPTASVAKVMTAYVFLTSHPLKFGDNGPTYTISPEEAARLPERKAREESHVDVVANQPFTEREALEALMIVSANNIAHEMARWDAGDEQAFLQKMNDTAKQLGMTNTTYTDPSGYDSTTVSTAADQVKLLRAAMRIPAFGEVVGKRYYVPSNGGAPRTGGNTIIGRYGVIGGKTGFTDKAGGNYVFAARKKVDGVSALIVGAVMAQTGATTPAPAVESARKLILAAGKAMVSTTVAEQGQRVAHVDDGLGGKTPLTATTRVTVVGWPGLTVRLGTTGDVPAQAAGGDRLGTLSTGAGQVPLNLDKPLNEPSLVARLLRLA